jgi:hypothetical protein
MKATGILKIAALAMPLLLSSCASKKKAAVENKTSTTERLATQGFIAKVQENAVSQKFISSKVKFSIETGAQKMTLTGNLKMKRDDCIRLQLMAFGFVEAGRIELTPEYVLIMDRINKQYLKAPYVQVDFLRNNGMNFYTMQALFWNELSKPAKYSINKDDMPSDDAQYTMIESGDDMVINLEAGKMMYSWLASRIDGQIRMANMLYKDKINNSVSQLNWDYQEFEDLNDKKFPKKYLVTLTAPKKEVKLGMTLNYFKSDSEWETRTEVSNKYREVTIDEILNRFMSL